MVIIGWAIVWVAVIAAICFLAYLGFCWLVVTKTGSTEGLRDVGDSDARLSAPDRWPAAALTV